MIRYLVKALIFVFLLFPFLILSLSIHDLAAPPLEEFSWALKNTLVQATWSALFSLFLGLFGAMGLISLLRKPFWQKKRKWIEGFVLLPNILPPLFVLLSCLNLIQPFPFGIMGIVIIHSVLNIGLASVTITHLIESQLGRMVELAYVEGSSLLHFLIRGGLGVLRKDLILVFLFIFILCFSSFAIPLIVGGSQGTTIEVLMYEKIQISGKWGEALFIAFFQLLVFVLGVFLFHRQSEATSTPQRANLRLLELPWGWLFPVLAAGIVVIGQIQGFLIGWEQNEQLLKLPLLSLFAGTLFTSLGVGSLVWILLMVVASLFPSPQFQKFLLGYVAPSTVIVGFSFILIQSISIPIKIVLAITLLTFASLYRLQWESVLTQLSGQITIAKTLGATQWMVFKEIVFPQVLKPAGYLSGLAAFWACGDFALSRIIAENDFTLALTVESLMSHYRLHLATVLSWPLMFTGISCFILFQGIEYVFCKKTLS